MVETKWLTVIEAVQYLKMGRSTVYELAHEGKLPNHKVGRQWRFGARELDKRPFTKRFLCVPSRNRSAKRAS